MDIEIRQYTDVELSWWLGLHALPTLGFPSKHVRTLLDRFNGPSVWTATRKDVLERDSYYFSPIIDEFIEKRSKINAEELLEQLKASGIDAYPIADPRYPFRLREIHDPPAVLFVKGQLFQLDFNNAVAVVGTRVPSPYGSKIAKDMARGLSSSGAVVVSGLALGIDSIAHWGAIEGGGRTIAVMASGADLCYPSSNKRLYNKILEEQHGAVVTEFFAGVRPEKWHFPARNRIIAGMCKGLVVIEAGETSGALITARMAFEHDRDVFAVPGRIDSPTSAGTIKLMVDKKAQVVRNYEDVLQELNWVRTKIADVATVVELYGREKEIYEILTSEPSHFDVLCEQSGMPAGEMSATLTMLELAGLVVRHPGDCYARQDMSLTRSRPSMSPGF